MNDRRALCGTGILPVGNRKATTSSTPPHGQHSHAKKDHGQDAHATDDYVAPEGHGHLGRVNCKHTDPAIRSTLEGLGYGG
jgi:hypothetical protein